MNITINLNDETSDVLRQATDLTGLPIADIIDRMFAPIEADLSAVLTLVNAQPELREQAANLIVCFGPESIEAGIKRIAPGYETPAARFARSIDELTRRSTEAA
jgi:hypothetical protein